MACSQYLRRDIDHVGIAAEFFKFFDGLQWVFAVEYIPMGFGVGREKAWCLESFGFDIWWDDFSNAIAAGLFEIELLFLSEELSGEHELLGSCGWWAFQNKIKLLLDIHYLLNYYNLKCNLYEVML